VLRRRVSLSLSTFDAALGNEIAFVSVTRWFVCDKSRRLFELAGSDSDEHLPKDDGVMDAGDDAPAVDKPLQLLRERFTTRERVTTLQLVKE
jgi:hypothetical protein